jgi:hypothetical protein
VKDKSIGDYTQGQALFGSAHAEGCYFAMADASVHFIGYSISPIIYPRLGNRKDGQPVSWGSF